MFECPNCDQWVEMIDDSSVESDRNVYQIFLECPECGWRFLGEFLLDDLRPLEPLGED